LGICVIHVILWLIKKPGLTQTDDHYYIEEAKNILSGAYHFDISPKNHRLGLILPTAFFMSLFGNSVYVTSLFPLLISLASIVVLFNVLRRHVSPAAAILAAGLLSFNILQIDFISCLFPDVALSFWIFLFALCLYNWIHTHNNIWLAANLGCFVMGFFTKELMVAVVPYAAIILLIEARRNRSIREIMTYGFSFLLLVAGVCLACFLIAGDPFMLNKGVEEYHNEAFGKHFSTQQVLHRLFAEPFVLLNRSLGLLTLLLPALLLLLPHARRIEKNSLSCHVIVLLFTLLAYLWFGTSSLTSYVPVWIIERMWIPLVLPACFIMGAFFHNSNSTIYMMLAIIFILLGFEQAWFFGWKRLGLFALFSLSYLLASHKVSEKYKLPLAIAPYLALAVYFVLTN